MEPTDVHPIGILFSSAGKRGLRCVETVKMHAILYYTEHINILWMGQRNHAPGRVAIGIPMKHCKSWDPSVRACSATLGPSSQRLPSQGLDHSN